MYKLEEQFQVLFYITKGLTLLSGNKRSIIEFSFKINILLVRGTLSKLLITILGISNVTEYTEKPNYIESLLRRCRLFPFYVLF